MRSELEDLVREQAEDMRYGGRVRRQGDAWMHAVVSLDQIGADRVDSQGHLPERRIDPWGCPIHERRHASLDSMGRPQCAECHREHMRAYAQSDKGKARHKRYAQRPEVRERRNERKRVREAAKRAGVVLVPLPRGPKPRIPFGDV